MTQIYFQDLMEEGFGCHYEGRVAFGVHKSWPYSAELEQPGAKVRILFRFVVDGDAGKAAGPLRKQAVAHTSWGTAQVKDGSVLVATLEPPDDFYAKADIHGLLLAATDALLLAGLQPPTLCPLCGLADCDSYAFLDDGYRVCHKACLDTRLTLPEADQQPAKKAKGFLLTGILGALVGAVIGSLPNWVQALNKGTIHWALYAFIPIFSALVYRLFRGKAKLLPAAASVLVASFAAAFALEQVWYWLYLTDVTGVVHSFRQSIAEYFATHFFLSSLYEMAFSLAAMMVGFFPAAVFIRQYVKSGLTQKRTVRGSIFVRASTAPIQPPASGPNDAPPEKPAADTHTDTKPSLPAD